MRRVASALDLTSSKIAGLARYWEARRGQRAMPTWADFDPAEIKPLLPHLMVTRYERNPFRVRYTLVGTWVAQYGGADFTGRYLDELEFPSEVDTDWSALHLQLATEGKPIFVASRFLESGLERNYETAMFPISDPAGTFVERGIHIEDFPSGTHVAPDQDAIALAPKPTSTSAPRAKDSRLSGPQLLPIAATDPDFRRCLSEAKLETADLVGVGKRYFQLTEAGRCRGYGGFEACGTHALLRSIVIEGRERGHGYGRSLVNGLIAEARKHGLKKAWLLTETAAPFFAALGFTPGIREAAPPEIATTDQFATLCPAHAKLMRREIS